MARFGSARLTRALAIIFRLTAPHSLVRLDTHSPDSAELDAVLGGNAARLLQLHAP